MRTDPLAYLGKELDALKEQNLYRQLRILEDEQKAHTTFDHRRSSTSRRTTISA